MNWPSKLQQVNQLAQKRQSLVQKQDLHSSLMLMKDLKLLVNHMDSIKTLNHTFQKPIWTDIDINHTRD